MFERPSKSSGFSPCFCRVSPSSPSLLDSPTVSPLTHSFCHSQVGCDGRRRFKRLSAKSLQGADMLLEMRLEAGYNLSAISGDVTLAQQCGDAEQMCARRSICSLGKEAVHNCLQRDVSELLPTAAGRQACR